MSYILVFHYDICVFFFLSVNTFSIRDLASIKNYRNFLVTFRIVGELKRSIFDCHCIYLITAKNMGIFTEQQFLLFHFLNLFVVYNE